MRMKSIAMFYTREGAVTMYAIAVERHGRWQAGIQWEGKRKLYDIWADDGDSALDELTKRAVVDFDGTSIKIRVNEE